MVLAGLFLLWPVLKEHLILYMDIIFKILLNNNSLIVLNPMETMDVKEVLWTMVSNISEIILSVLKNPMDIPPKMVHA